MDLSEKPAYPGSRASATEIIELANEYDNAAQALLQSARKGEPLSRAPFRLCAIHAIELYLNAFLRSLGETPEQIRARRHDLAGSTKLAADGGLKLRKKTAEHLVRMSQQREYLASRYGPELASGFTEVNRLLATLDEVGKKVKCLIPGETAETGPVGA